MESAECSPADLLRNAPLRGRGWYHASCVRAALEFGVLARRSITHTATASCHVPADKFAAAVGRLMNAFPSEEVALADASGANLQKNICNHLVGLFGRRRPVQRNCTTSRCAQDEEALAPLGASFRRPVAGCDGWWDFIQETPLVGRHTLFLLYRKVVDEESAMLARTARAVQAIPRSVVHQLNTDSVLFTGPAGHPEDERVRCFLTEHHRLKGHRRLPVRDDAAPRAPADWLSVNEEEAERHVLAGGGLCIEALAGTGKSTFLRHLAARLRENGRSVLMCAVTHVATANLEPDAMTLCRFVFQYGRGIRMRLDCRIVDEFSLIDGMIWCHLATIYCTTPSASASSRATGTNYHRCATTRWGRRCPACETGRSYESGAGVGWS